MGNSGAKQSFSALLQQLAAQELDAGAQDFWDQLWKTPLAAEVRAVPHPATHSLTHSLTLYRVCAYIE